MNMTLGGIQHFDNKYKKVITNIKIIIPTQRLSGDI